MSESNSSTNRDLAGTRYDRELYQNIADVMINWLDSDSSGHDADHAWRVFNLGIRIAKEENADAEIVGAAALTHDIHRIMGSPNEYVEPAESLPEVRSVLESTDFPEEKILLCITTSQRRDDRVIAVESEEADGYDFGNPPLRPGSGHES